MYYTPPNKKNNLTIMKPALNKKKALIRKAVTLGMSSFVLSQHPLIKSRTQRIRGAEI